MTDLPDPDTLSGTALDAAVAVELFDWKRWTGPTGFQCFGSPGGGHRDGGPPAYSSDWNAMREVVEKLKETHDVTLCHWDQGEERGNWRCDLAPKKVPVCDKCGKTSWGSVEVWATEAGEAVCRAAIKAVRGMA